MKPSLFSLEAPLLYHYAAFCTPWFSNHVNTSRQHHHALENSNLCEFGFYQDFHLKWRFGYRLIIFNNFWSRTKPFTNFSLNFTVRFNLFLCALFRLKISGPFTVQIHVKKASVWKQVENLKKKGFSAKYSLFSA